MIDWTDYIRPNEFRYCERRQHLLMVPEAPCPACSAVTRLVTEPAMFEEFQRGINEHRELEARRLALAEQRRDLGMRPRWWNYV
jgi:hypothetical protein